MSTFRNRLFLSIAGLGALSASASAQSTIFVDANLTTGSNDGSSWADAFQGVDGLQAALATTAPGDEVFVADGLYLPSATGLRGASFRLDDDVTIYGGFLGGESSPADRPPFDSAPSILSGDLQGDDGAGMVDDNSYHVVRGVGSSNTAIMDGFRIVAGNGNGSGNNRDRGGGILMTNNSQGVIRNCRFVGNQCTFGGGAGYVIGAPTFLNCQFEDNIGGAFGGAFDIAGSGAILFDGCTFTGNQAARAGAVEIFSTTGARVLNCVFSDNRATGSNGGGGLWIGANSNAQIRNCTVVGNISSQAGGITVSGANPTIANCIIWNNENNAGNQNPANQVTQSANVTYSIVQGGMTGTGNVAGDPAFVDAMNGDFSLSLASAGIDAGNNASMPVGFVLDLAGNPRFVDESSVPDTGNGTSPIIDMGALEVQSAGGIGMGDTNCVPVPNSTGVSAVLTATGSLSLAANDLNLAVGDLPVGQFAYFVMSETTGSASVGSGVLCLGAPFFRFTDNVLNSGAAGAVTFSPDFLDLPQGQVFQSGETWYFQLWHRDMGGTSNLSNNLGFTWQ